MSKGGTINVIINQQNPDDLINNSKRLLDRLDEFNKKAEGIVLDPSNPNYISMKNSVAPIINFLERTHHVFVNSSFKPNIPVSFEYTKVSAANPSFGSLIPFDIKPYGDFWSDMVLNIKLTGLSAVDSRDRVRYATMVGHRIGTLYQVQIQGVKIDEYDYNNYNIYYNTEVSVDRKTLWMRNMGQEIPITGFLTPDPNNDMYREYRTIGNGYQTLKQNQDDLDLWIPLLFWFKDVRHALPQIIPNGQFKILVQLANIQDLIGVEDLGGGGLYNAPKIATCDLYVNNIFMQDDIFQIYLNNFTFSLIRVHTYQLSTITSSAISYEKLYGIRYPVETIFIGFRPRANLELSQYWNKYCALQNKSIPTAVMVKNPSLTLTGTVISANDFGEIIIVNSSLSTQTNYYLNYYFVLTDGVGYIPQDITLNQYIVTQWNPITSTITINGSWNGEVPNSSTTWELYALQPGHQYIEYYQETPVVNTLELRAYNIPLRGPFPSSFFDQYIPFRYGSNRFTASGNIGIYIMNFNLYPMNLNPSGHIDFTQTRENYLYWTSNIISESNPVDLIIYSKSINFLILRNNQAILRYSY
jgi:hypothetical protein